MSLPSAREVLLLVLLGIGLSHCKGAPEQADAGVRDAGVRDAGVRDAGVRDAGVDGGMPDAGWDAGPPVQTLMRDVSLLDVDAPQRWLVAVERDGGGTVAQDLASGETRRIAPAVQSGTFTRGGGVLVLTRPDPDGTHTVWLWRPGDAEASVMSTQVWSNVVINEGATPYAFFVERTAGGGADLRRVFPLSCAGGACPVETVARVEAELAGALDLFMGARFLWMQRGTRAWVFDMEQGTLAEAGGDPSHLLRVSPSGDRFARLTPEQILYLYDHQTQVPLWAVPVPPGQGNLRELSFFDEDTVIVSTATSAGTFPPRQRSHACTWPACTFMGETACHPRKVGGTTLLFCSASDCSDASCSTRYRVMSRPDVTLSYRGDSIDREPAVSDDLSTVAWMTYDWRDPPGTRTLLLEQRTTEQRLSFPQQINTTVFDFVPGQQRFVFTQPKQDADGGVENVLSLLGETGVEEVGVVEGTPFQSLIRTDPPRLYLNGVQEALDGGIDATLLQRFEL